MARVLAVAVAAVALAGPALAAGTPQHPLSPPSPRLQAAEVKRIFLQDGKVAAHRFSGDVVGLRQFGNRGTASRDHQRGDRLLTLFGIHETPFVW